MKFIFIAFISFLICAVSLGQSVNLPLEHWGYDFLDRLETRGLFDSYELRTRPVPRDVITGLLVQVLERVKGEPGLLSTAEWRRFEQLMSDFSGELQALDVTTANIPAEPHVLKFHEPSGSVYFDALGRQSVISNRGDQYRPTELLSETTLGGILRGHLGNTIGFYVDARNAITRGSDIEDESFDVSQGSPVVTSGPNVIRDRATAYLVWQRPWLRIQAGKDEIDWGPAFHGGLALTRNAPPADMIRMSTRFKNFKFTSTHMWLQSGLGAKYMAAHRLDVRLFSGVYVGGSETVIYGDRNVEPSYLNPLMPYHVAEHHLGDKDNNAMSVDLTVTRFPSTKFYAEFFIDDMTSTQSLTSYFGNKWALLLGGQWVDPLGLQNVDIRAEYARIEPFVYTHWDSLNIYTHYDKVIGHWLGPNADTFFLQLGWQPTRDFRCRLSLERIRQGEGEADTNSIPVGTTRKQFLGTLVETRQLYTIELLDQLFRDMFVGVSYTMVETDNANLVKGCSTTDHLARFEFYFNF